MKMIEPANQMKGGIIINDNIGSQIQGDVNFESCFCYFVKNSNFLPIFIFNTRKIFPLHQNHTGCQIG